MTEISQQTSATTVFRPDAVEVQTTTTVTAATSQASAVTKIIVAVHGVGDQYSFATIQSVVNQFCNFYGAPAGIPLGNFHTDSATFSVGKPYPPEPFGRLAFAEVYWAKIPREVVDDKHTIEEAKKWAQTIVERLRLRWRSKNRPGGYDERDFQLINHILLEMIQTIAVIDRLSFVLDKAGIFTFDIKQLLEDYLGDVQVVADFRKQRDKILAAFSDVMTKVNAAYPNAEIHLVTHSEGTVVSFLGLLEAFRKMSPPAWTGQVRGFMTLGSPIDKHLVLWPELFEGSAPTKKPAHRIEWRNYYDFGDPIGFALDDARAWLRQSGWDAVFNFTEDKGHDNGFSRYPFPGKAHVDYWTDDAVFGHFIQNVVAEKPPAAVGGTTKSYEEPPGNLFGRRFVSYVIPYMFVVALLTVGTYILFKAVTGAIAPGEFSGSAKTIAKGVAGIVGLLVGVTVASRIPRLSRSRLWRGVGVGFGALSATVYMWSVYKGDPIPSCDLAVSAGWPTVAMSIVFVGLAYGFSALKPDWGLKPLIILGTGAVFARVGCHVWTATDRTVWPVLLATAAFIYLWWLAALFFDLVFVWHLYIRHSRVLHRMDEILGGERLTTRQKRRSIPVPAVAPQVRS